jgi:hypothetical protein
MRGALRRQKKMMVKRKRFAVEAYIPLLAQSRRGGGFTPVFDKSTPQKLFLSSCQYHDIGRFLASIGADLCIFVSGKQR